MEGKVSERTGNFDSNHTTTVCHVYTLKYLHLSIFINAVNDGNSSSGIVRDMSAHAALQSVMPVGSFYINFIKS